MQIKFQRDCFLALGNNFVSIDATHNSTQYARLQLFTLLVRDLWGHGTLFGIFLLMDVFFVHHYLQLRPRAETMHTMGKGRGKCLLHREPDVSL